MEDRLQKFAYMIDAGSVTRAAKELHISQPALSMAMQKLERELGAMLFVRGSSPLMATEAGEQAYKSAKELSTSIRSLRAALSDAAKKEVSLSLGMIDSIADGMVASRRIVGVLESQAKISLVINNSRYLLEALERGEIDIAIITEKSRVSNNRLQYEYVGLEPLVVAVHKTQCLVIQQEMSAGVLQSFISYDQPSRTHAFIRHFFEEHEVTLSPRFFSSSPDVILRLVLAQKGAAALPYRKIRSYIQSGKLVPIAADAVVHRPIAVVYRRNYQAPQLVQAVVLHLRNDLSVLLKSAADLK